MLKKFLAKRFIGLEIGTFIFTIILAGSFLFFLNVMGEVIIYVNN